MKQRKMTGNMGQKMEVGDRGTVMITCVRCHTPTDTGVTSEEYAKWQGGLLIQDAMPNVPKELRELFISGYCGKCWDEIFPTEVDDGDYDED